MNAQLAAAPAANTPTARECLQQAQAKLKEATDNLQRRHDQRQALLDLGQRPAEIAERLQAARDEHMAALTAWAEAGASGESPAPPAAIAKLEAQLAIANREADAAAKAAAKFDPGIAEAQQEADAALAELKHRRTHVLYQIAAPMIDEYQQAALKANSLREHLAGLGHVGKNLLDENPGLSGLSMAIGDAIRFRPVLEPGGAEASRQAWRDVIADLGGDASAELGAAPASVDPDARIRRPFLPHADTDRDTRIHANLRGAA